MTDRIMTFAGREEFRQWLQEHCRSSSGVWLLFGKSGGPETLTAAQALEEALCFGWIDGQLERLDDRTYRKYFAPRRKNSRWSKKNRTLAENLERQGLMTGFGREKIKEAKKNGLWDAPESAEVTQEQIAGLTELLRGCEPALTNFQAMPPSVKKTYTRAYFDAKTDDGRERRLAWMVERLNKNLRPM